MMTGFANFDDFEHLLATHPELWAMSMPSAVPQKTLDTSRGPSVVLTEDGGIGLWVKLDAFQTAEWNAFLEYAVPPDEPDADAEAAVWDDFYDESAYHEASMVELCGRMAQWLVPLRKAIVARGWGDALLMTAAEQTERDGLAR